MKTIAVIARKGGSGKTTVAVHLALAAHRAGLATVLADTDPQGSATEVLKARAGGRDRRNRPRHRRQHLGDHRRAADLP